MKNSGFTLIELMIVVAIIAIIAAIAIPSLLRAKISANEAAAIGCCKAFAEAEEIYRRTDWDRDEVLEYSAMARGPNSLYESDWSADDIGLIDRTFAYAFGDPAGISAPKSGYAFFIMRSQGALAPGGARSYVIKGNLIGGYALSAIPYSYDGTGRNSFMISANGTIFQNDQGPAVTWHQLVFNPDSAWLVAE